MQYVYQILLKESINYSCEKWQEIYNLLFKYKARINVINNNYTLKLYFISNSPIKAKHTDLRSFFLKPITQKINVNAATSLNTIYSYKVVLRWNIDLLRFLRKYQQNTELNFIALEIKPYSILGIKFAIYKFIMKNNSFVVLGPSVFCKLFELSGQDKQVFKLEKFSGVKNPVKIIELLTENKAAAIGQVDMFPVSYGPLYLPITSIDLSKHSVVVGQSGMGKSKLLELLISKIIDFNLPYKVFLIDPHIKLSEKLQQRFSKNTFALNFDDNSVNLLPSVGDPITATELTIQLLTSVLASTDAHLTRLLRFTLFTLFTLKKASINNLKRFLLEENYRQKILSSLPQNMAHIKHFFETDFLKYETTYYERTFMPIIATLEELAFLPGIVSPGAEYSADYASNLPSLDFISHRHKLVTIQTDLLKLGDKMTRLLSGLLIQQIFLLSQAGKFDSSVILFIDEAAIIGNKALPIVLSQARKFGLSLALVYQYLNQVDNKLLNSILGNIYNFFIFKCSETDASTLLNIIDVKLTKNYKDPVKEKQAKLKALLDLNPRELFARIYSNNKFYPSFKMKTVDI